MWLLLKYQGYPPAIFVALLIHGVIFYFLLENSTTVAEFVDVEQQIFVAASVIQENPQRLRKAEQLELQRVAVQTERNLEATRARDAERRRVAAEQEATEARAEAEAVEQRRQADQVAREEAEQAANQREREENERLLREEQIAQEQAAREADESRQAEAQRQAEQITTENQLIQSYTAIIHDAIVQNWSRPPSARNGMTVVLQIQLVPTGEVVSVTVVESSGDAAVDRSTEQAVSRVGRFYDLEGMPIGLFERSFRNFNLRFRPEDLLR